MKKIALSIGHYKDKTGAVFESFNEYEEATKWVKLIHQQLPDKTVLVPTGHLRDKVIFINSLSSIKFAVEIHFNSFYFQGIVPKGNGSETLYYPGSITGEDYAQRIQKHLGNLFAPNRGIKEGWYQMDKDKGVDYFLKETKCPALILEPEFIHNKHDIIQKRDTACLLLATVFSNLLK